MMDFQNSNKGTWREWANYILLTLEKIEKKTEELEDRINKIENKLNILMTKIAFIVGIGTFVMTLLSYLLIEWFKGL